MRFLGQAEHCNASTMIFTMPQSTNNPCIKEEVT